LDFLRRSDDFASEAQAWQSWS